MSKQARINTILEQNDLEGKLLFTTFVYIVIVCLASMGICQEVFSLSEEHSAVISIIVGAVFSYSCYHSSSGGVASVVNKETKKIAYSFKHGFTIIPPFSKYQVEKVKDFQIMTVEASKIFNPKGDNLKIEIEMYGDFIVIDSEKFLKEGGRQHFSAKALGELKDMVKRQISNYGSISQDEIEEISTCARRKVQEKFGICFHEFATLRAVLY